MFVVDRTFAAGGGVSDATTILPRMSAVLSRGSATKIVVPETSVAAFDVGVISDHKVSGFPRNVTELETLEMRVRRMFHH